MHGNVVMKVKCEHCKGTGEVEAMEPERMICPRCSFEKMKLTRNDGWYCQNCEAGPFVVGVFGLQLKSK